MDPVKKVIMCTSSDPHTITTSDSSVKVTKASSRVVQDSVRSRPQSFELPYDVLVVAIGAEVNTFGIKVHCVHCCVVCVITCMFRAWGRTHTS